ncbi:hypothetical protein ACFWIB_26835 [Streptomyces sp. NPDC127051]|uniref:hypothetical protein n=1 Tax=Streptomyces sp. NPDC127051 TaxID=3347119 RepID=UPI003661957C
MYMTPLAQATAEALRAAAEALTAQQPKGFEPTPDGYYNRPDTPAEEITEALRAAGIHLHSRPL